MLKRTTSKLGVLKIIFLVTSIPICISWSNDKSQSSSFTSSRYFIRFISGKYGNETKELNSFHFDFDNKEITLKSDGYLNSFYIDSLRAGFLSNENDEIVYKNSSSTQFVYCHKLQFVKESKKEEKRKYLMVVTKLKNNIVTLEIADLKDGFVFLYLK